MRSSSSPGGTFMSALAVARRAHRRCSSTSSAMLAAIWLTLGAMTRGGEHARPVRARCARRCSSTAVASGVGNGLPEDRRMRPRRVAPDHRPSGLEAPRRARARRLGARPDRGHAPGGLVLAGLTATMAAPDFALRRVEPTVPLPDRRDGAARRAGPKADAGEGPLRLERSSCPSPFRGGRSASSSSCDRSSRAHRSAGRLRRPPVWQTRTGARAAHGPRERVDGPLRLRRTGGDARQSRS